MKAHRFPLYTPVVVKHKRDGRLIAGAVTEHVMVQLPGGALLPALRNGEPVYRVQVGPLTEMEAGESQLSEVSYGD